MKKVLIFSFIIIFSLVFFNFAQAEWEEPSADPPGGNVSPPLNQGNTAQYKEGGLLIGDDDTTLLEEEGNVFGVTGAGALFTETVKIGGQLTAGVVDLTGLLTARNGILVQFADLTINTGTLDINSGNIDIDNGIIEVLNNNSANSITATSTLGTAVYGITTSGNAVYGKALGVTGIAIAGLGNEEGGLAGRFDGEVVFNPLGTGRTVSSTIIGGKINVGEDLYVANDVDINGDVDIDGDLTVITDAYHIGGVLEVGIGGLTLYADAEDGMVGIGTDSPNAKLHVYSSGGSGNTDINLEYNFTGTTNGSRDSNWVLSANSRDGKFQIMNPTVDRLAIDYGGNVYMSSYDCSALGNSGKLTTNASGQIICANDIGGDTGPDDDWTIGVNDIYRETGNVGIGTDNPGYPLHITYSDSESPGLYIENVAGNQEADASITLVDDRSKTYYTFGLDANRDDGTDRSFIISDSDSFDSPRFMIENTSGYIGIGITDPAYNLDVSGDINFTGDLYQNGEIYSSGGGGEDDGDWTISGSNIYSAKPGNVGIGDTTPSEKLEVFVDDEQNQQSAIKGIATYSGEKGIWGVNNAGYGVVGESDDNVGVQAFTVGGTALQVVAESGTIADFQSDGGTQVIITNQGYVGIKKINPTVELEVDGDSIITGKLTVGTIDPIYVIAEERYATYGHSTIGVKEEVLGKININEKINENLYQYEIDFSQQKDGSDLWLFNEITDFGQDWQNLIVMLTPQGRADVWYEIEADKNLLMIYSSQPVYVSYRLVAPRFDNQEHPTYLPDSEYEGLKVR